MSDSFTIDPDELDAVIADIARTETALETLSNDLRQQIQALHAEWEGLAAQAHAEAQQEWDQGMAAMRGALADIRAAAETAGSNYRGAAEANRSMWAGLA
ncbi:WXG100 family type VII secretion target [Nocardioides plantarum]|uniref:ESAT-6-like protein n=1 Tax=Nocardioides plantarum TaxID=29299 RepID=A0ABV5KC29_9ACTN|nr:WXG100 family type VII secretion target [Nocardioides plantarum]